MSFSRRTCTSLLSLPAQSSSHRSLLSSRSSCSRIHSSHTSGSSSSRVGWNRTVQSRARIEDKGLLLRARWKSAQPRRAFSTTPVAQHGHLDAPKPGQERKVTFVDKEGDSHTFEVADGDNLLDIAQANDLEMEGACGGSCACSTCHVIVSDPDYYDKMGEPDDDENDMLDLAFGLTETSRLGCQVKMSKEMDGLEVKLPSMTRNLQASDFEDKKKKDA